MDISQNIIDSKNLGQNDREKINSVNNKTYFFVENKQHKKMGIRKKIFVKKKLKIFKTDSYQQKSRKSFQ